MTHPVDVWAPNAATVAVCIGNAEEPMRELNDGWWRFDSPLDPSEHAYAFRVDGGKELPDPRSARQPNGVHGRSLAVNHSAFGWSDAGFQPVPLSAALIYEAHIGTFSPEGTFDGAIAKLDHLSDLGVTHLELMPVCAFSGERGWGYDGVDLFAPHEAYGGPDGLKRLVDAAHAKRIAVVLDVVYNHLGPEGNYLSQFGPYFTSEHHTSWGDAVNLDGPESHHVRRFLADNALMWLRDYHVDALRIDAIHAFHDTSAIHFLEQVSEEVSTLSAHLGRDLVLIAESDLNDPRVVTSCDACGWGIDAQWSDDFHHALHAAITGERRGYYAGFGDLADIKRALERTFVYDGRFSPERRRIHGRSAAHIRQDRFLGFHQNHDQVGNRAVGERLSHLASPDRCRVSAALLLLGPFVPMLFQGEEWAASTPFQYFTDHGDEGLGRAVSEGRRREFRDFGWRPEDVPDPQDEATFRRSILNWDELERPEHRAMLDWYHDLIRLRRTYPELAAGAARPVVTINEAEQTLLMRRGGILVAVNLSDADRVVELDSAAGQVLLASKTGVARTDGPSGPASLRLPSESVAVVG